MVVIEARASLSPPWRGYVDAIQRSPPVRDTVVVP